MPLNVPDHLPAIDVLRDENIFVMTESRAIAQDIRPLKILILNLMPIKITTEAHLLRVLSNSPLQVKISFLNISTHQSKNTPKDHLDTFYYNFDQIQKNRYDGLIITGAPVEHLAFEEVDYWEEIKQIMDWAKTNVTSTFNICWAAQAGLYYHYGIKKYPAGKKVFGIYDHNILDNKIPLVRGFDDHFLAPHSRNTFVKREDILQNKDLIMLSESDEAGVYLVVSRDGKQVFVTGHSEYDANTLKSEYDRDIGKGIDIDLPKNYFPDNDPTKKPPTTWRSHANLLFSNWLNYYVYQETPYNIES